MNSLYPVPAPVLGPPAVARPAGRAAGLRLFALVASTLSGMAVVVASLPASVVNARRVAYPPPVVSMVTTNLGRGPYHVGVRIRFTADVSAGHQLSFGWSFGDGTEAAGAQIVHTFKKYSASTHGIYTVALTAHDPVGQTVVVNKSLKVLPIPPVARFTYDDQELYVSFNAHKSTGTGIRYSWNFGDGSKPGSGVAPAQWCGSPGIYTVILTVTDVAGQKATNKTGVYVSVPGPTADIEPFENYTDQYSTCFQFYAGDSTGYAPLTYLWFYEDGSTGSGVWGSDCFPTGTGYWWVEVEVTDAFGQTAWTYIYVYV